MARLLLIALIEDQAQDLVEYTLLLAFVMFTIVGLATGFHSSIAGVVAVTNSNLSAANEIIR